MTSCRTVREADHAVLGAIRNDPATQFALLADPQPNDARAVQAWIDRRTDDPNGLFRVIADEGDRAVGFVQVVDIDARSRHGTFGIAVHSEKRGNGHARAAMQDLFRIARDDGRLDKLILHVASENSARRLYDQLGFREVGVLRRHYRGAEAWHDVVVMERFLGDAS